MPRFSEMVKNGMLARGHDVRIWRPVSMFARFPGGASTKKWLGYIDELLIFPAIVWMRLKFTDKTSVFIFPDQGLGPWIPLVSKRPHVVHCHDLLAIRVAMGDFPTLVASTTGAIYQRLILRGLCKANRFIPVSRKTEIDLVRVLGYAPENSEVVYNGLNYSFYRMDPIKAREFLTQALGYSCPNSFLMHVGGNQWYKNRQGVLAIYKEYVSKTANPLPLLMFGAKPSTVLLNQAKAVGDHGTVQFVEGAPNEAICAAYSLTAALIFPSIAEGFGWPIIEAMACGCTVLTTNEAPMNEVGGEDAVYIDPISAFPTATLWADSAASTLIHVLGRSQAHIDNGIAAGIRRAALFEPEKIFDSYERQYQAALESRHR